MHSKFFSSLIISICLGARVQPNLLKHTHILLEDWKVLNIEIIITKYRYFHFLFFFFLNIKALTLSANTIKKTQQYRPRAEFSVGKEETDDVMPLVLTPWYNERTLIH